MVRFRRRCQIYFDPHQIIGDPSRNASNTVSTWGWRKFKQDCLVSVLRLGERKGMDIKEMLFA